MPFEPQGKTVLVKNLLTNKETYSEGYDKLVLSPGLSPFVRELTEYPANRIFTLRNVPDTDTIKGYINTIKPKRALVIGGGFIGLEMAENLHELGIEVGVIEMANQVMAPLGLFDGRHRSSSYG